MKYLRAGLKTIAVMVAVSLLFWGFMWLFDHVSMKTGFIIWGTLTGMFFGGLLFWRFLEGEKEKNDAL